MQRVCDGPGKPGCHVVGRSRRANTNPRCPQRPPKQEHQHVTQRPVHRAGRSRACSSRGCSGRPAGGPAPSWAREATGEPTTRSARGILGAGRWGGAARPPPPGTWSELTTATATRPVGVSSWPPRLPSAPARAAAAPGSRRCPPGSRRCTRPAPRPAGPGHVDGPAIHPPAGTRAGHDQKCSRPGPGPLSAQAMARNISSLICWPMSALRVARVSEELRPGELGRELAGEGRDVVAGWPHAHEQRPSSRVVGQTRGWP
jgi:hypothetical protein